MSDKLKIIALWVYLIGCVVVFTTITDSIMIGTEESFNSSVSDKVTVRPDLEIIWTPEWRWREEVARLGKPAWFFLTSPENCRSCREIKIKVLTNTAVIRELQRFICVKIDTEVRWAIWQNDGWPYSAFGNMQFKPVLVGGERLIVTPKTCKAFITHLKQGYKLANPQGEKP